MSRQLGVQFQIAQPQNLRSTLKMSCEDYTPHYPNLKYRNTKKCAISKANLPP